MKIARSAHPSLSNYVVRTAGLCGGTHGNEPTGVAAVNRRRAVERTPSPGSSGESILPEPRLPETFALTPLIANPRAVERNRRYVDFDLNRCFSADSLDDRETAAYERRRAQVLNRLFGPKGSPVPAAQFLIDLHTTTSNLGPTVIIREDGALARIIAAATRRAIPEVRILSYFAESADREAGDATPPLPAGGGPGSANRAGDYPYLAEITPHGIEVEVGPTPQGVVRADVLIWTERIVNAIIATIDAWNRDEEIEVADTITVYRLVGDLDFPRTEDGSLAGAIHPERQDRDFEPLREGDPLFVAFDGEEIRWTGNDGALPVFINEAAYYEKRAALTLARAVDIATVSGECITRPRS